MILVDLQKAFNTVDHSILLAKLESVGLDPNSVMWFKSYLSDIMQQVDVGGVLSKFASVVSGVPRRSILGPMLFLVYVNDLAMACDYPLLCADDTVLLLSGKSVTDVEQNLNSQLESVNKWLIQNKYPYM